MWPAAPCSLSGLATGHAQRLGAHEEALSCLRYFCPTTLHPHPTSEPCPREEVRVPQVGGSRQEGVPQFFGSESAHGLQGTGCSGTHVFLWEPSCTKMRGKPSAMSLFICCPDFLGQPASRDT